MDNREEMIPVPRYVLERVIEVYGSSELRNMFVVAQNLGHTYCGPTFDLNILRKYIREATRRNIESGLYYIRVDDEVIVGQYYDNSGAWYVIGNECPLYDHLDIEIIEKLALPTEK